MPRAPAVQLHRIGYVRFRSDKRPARDDDNSLIWPAARARGELAGGICGDIASDDGKITRLKLKDVRTTFRCFRLCAGSVGIGAEPTDEFHAGTYY